MMISAVNATAGPFDSDAPDGNLRPIIRYNPDDCQENEMVEALWGSNPRFTDGLISNSCGLRARPFLAITAWSSPRSSKCGSVTWRCRVKLDDGNFFYLAGVWDSPLGDWPLSFRIVTVAASPEVSHCPERHPDRKDRASAAATVPGTHRELTPCAGRRRHRRRPAVTQPGAGPGTERPRRRGRAVDDANARCFPSPADR